MKIIIICSTFLLNVFAYSQTFQNTPVRSSINLSLIQKAMETKQRDYDDSKKIKCSSMINFLLSNYSASDVAITSTSSWLLKVNYLVYNGVGYAIATIKRDEYLENTDIYIYCNISYDRWGLFKNDGEKYSWGKSFNYYISDLKCDCK